MTSDGAHGRRGGVGAITGPCPAGAGLGVKKDRLKVTRRGGALVRPIGPFRINREGQRGRAPISPRARQAKDSERAARPAGGRAGR